MAFVAPFLAAGAAAGGSAFAGTSLATALTVGSAALTGVSAIQQGHYQAAVAANNAEIAQRNAAMESEAAQKAGARQDRETAALVGEQTAAAAASGLDVLGRTQVAVRNLSRRVGREEAGDIVGRGTAAARGLLQDAANFRAEGKQAKLQGYMTAAGAALEGGRAFAKDTGLTKSLASKYGSRKKFPWERKV